MYTCMASTNKKNEIANSGPKATQKLAQINEESSKRSSDLVDEASMEGTRQWQIVQEKKELAREKLERAEAGEDEKAKTGEHKKISRLSRLRKQHREITAEAVFGHEDFIRGRTVKEGDAQFEVDKGGLDFLSYRQDIVEPLLIPAIRTIAAAAGKDPEKILVIENGAPIHKKAHRTLLSDGSLFKENSYNRVDQWPPNSPDLQPVENIWDRMKDLVDHDWVPGGNTLLERQKARDLLVDLWNREEVVEAGVRLCQNWRKKLERCIDHARRQQLSGMNFASALSLICLKESEVNSSVFLYEVCSVIRISFFLCAINKGVTCLGSLSLCSKKKKNTTASGEAKSTKTNILGP